MLDIDIAPHETAIAPCQSRRARDEAGLFERHRAGDREARDALAEQFLPLAKRLALRYTHRDEYDDLVQVASVALIKAIDRYDPDRGPAFAAYAVPTIVGALKHYFRDHGWTVRVPRELHDRSLEVQRASEQMTARLGRSPTPAEIADALGYSVERVLEALQTESARRPDSLDEPTDPDQEHHERPTVAYEETGYALAEASVTLAPLLARLTPLERTILRLRFEHDLTQTQIGELTGVSQMHVSRLLRRTIAHLHDLAVHDARRGR
jgi:RNA polymerase sigma-B factor